MEIENFDIDLLTMRTVNITGVLSLRGIGSADAQPAWQQEEYTVAYSPEAGDGNTSEEKLRSPENDTLYENSLWTYGEGASEGSEEDQSSADPAEAAAEPLYAEDAAYTQPAAYLSTPLKDKEPRARTHSLDTASSAGSAVLNTVDHWGNAKLHAATQPEPVLTSAANDAAALFAGNEEGEAAEEIQATDNEVFLSAESLAPRKRSRISRLPLAAKRTGSRRAGAAHLLFAAQRKPRQQRAGGTARGRY